MNENSTPRFSVFPTGQGYWTVYDRNNRPVAKYKGLAKAMRAWPTAVPFGGAFLAPLDDAHWLAERANEMRQAAQANRKALVDGLVAAGATQSDAAALLGISRQRLGQLLAA